MSELLLTVTGGSTYKGILIMETDGGFLVFLGLDRIFCTALSSVTHLIDVWWELKKN